MKSPQEIAQLEHEAIVKFNEMLHSGKYSGEYCYRWLDLEKNKIKAMVEPIMWPALDFNFLYPEVINLDEFLKNCNGNN